METISGDPLWWDYGGDICHSQPHTHPFICHPAELFPNPCLNLNFISGPKSLACGYAMYIFSVCPRLPENSDPQSISVSQQDPRVSLGLGGAWCGKRESRVLKLTLCWEILRAVPRHRPVRNPGPFPKSISIGRPPT
ncbi:hypothetical protein C8R43DRAFT_1235367 [Mycena crocata]|nr:hypothetical protein C8R43DRAFT_1235367 [Mycena crocata]